MTYLKWLFIIDLVLVVLMSIISFFLFVNDKKKAEKGQMRTKEKTLLMSAVLNGSYGAFIGRKVAHHKTDKGYFSFTIYFGMLAQTCVIVLLAVLAFVL
jgi:uncharacterized membrane protein YsdA (DUF1294 family)